MQDSTQREDKTLPENLLNNKELTVLRYDNKNIDFISPQSLSNLSNLTEISLAHNSISTFQPDCYPFRKLRTLKLSHNRLKTVNFSLYSDLQVLDLEGNEITFLNVTYTSKLADINLKGNEPKVFVILSIRLK